MAHKRKGQLTVSGEWAKHLRPDGKLAFWKAERMAERKLVEREVEDDFHFGSWYEGMEGEKTLEDYWDEQWNLNEQSAMIMWNNKQAA